MATQPRTLTHEQVAALAESVGLPGEAFAQIAKGESGYQVGAVGHDPGGTQGLGLWQITTHYNDDIIKRFGGRERLLHDPLANAQAAKAIYDRQGIKAWYGTRYLTDPKAHYHGDTSQWQSASSPGLPGISSPAGGAAQTTLAPSAPSFGPSGDYASGLAALLAQPPQQPSSSAPIAPPAALAQTALPQGFRPIQSGGQAQEAPSSQSGLLEALRGAAPTPGSGGLPEAANVPVAQAVMQQRQRRTVAGAVESDKAAGVVPLGGSKNAGHGAFEISGPNPGRLKPELVSFAEKVAQVYGGPLVGKDGSTHSKYTVNGNVSEHYSGNATDIFEIGGKPAMGDRLMRAGRAALIAAGMPREQAMKAGGGLYNVGNHQVIFLTNEGGNHFDHLHISTHAR